MSLRDYYAANHQVTLTEALAASEIMGLDAMGGDLPRVIAHIKGLVADAMLAERNK